MLKIKLLFILLINITSIYGQELSEDVKSFVQIKAEPKDGLKAFYESFVSQFKTPNLPKDVNEITLRLKFIVETDGSFSNIQAINDQYGAGKEAIRVLKSMPAWNPAMHEGKYVRSMFTLPIKIRVKDALSKKQQKQYLATLNLNVIDTEFFDLTCNCGLVRSSKNEELRTIEYVMYSHDQTGIYNIVFRKMDESQADKELRVIEADAENQNATLTSINFVKLPTKQITFSMPDGDYTNYYRTLFFYKDSYLIGVSIVSFDDVLADLLLKHFKENFKLKF